jgi:hypothetical protein
VPANPFVEVRATSQADPTKSGSTFVQVLPYNPAGLTLLTILPINGAGSRRLFTYGVDDTSGVGNIAWIQPYFSPSFPLNPSGIGCHLIYFPTAGDPSTGTVYLDGDAGGSTWLAGSSAVGAGGVDRFNSSCTVHGATSSITLIGNDYYLNLDIEFRGVQLGVQKYAYLSAGSPSLFNPGTDWLYFGWWF